MLRILGNHRTQTGRQTPPRIPARFKKPVQKHNRWIFFRRRIIARNEHREFSLLLIDDNRARQKSRPVRKFPSRPLHRSAAHAPHDMKKCKGDQQRKYNPLRNPHLFPPQSHSFEWNRSGGNASELVGTRPTASNKCDGVAWASVLACPCLSSPHGHMSTFAHAPPIEAR